MARILIVEDEEKIARFVTLELEHEGYQVEHAADGRTAVDLALERDYDLILLDVLLPQLNGMEVLRRVRKHKDVPVIMVTARDAVMDKVAGLDAGADDYLTKPFGVAELRARARALLRRQSRTEDASPLFEFGEVRVDLSRRVVTRNGEPVRLTPIEYRLLCVLLASAGKVLTQRHLLREVWGPSSVESTHYLRIYVGHLRHKLEIDPAQPRHFQTETGVGYRFQP